MHDEQVVVGDRIWVSPGTALLGHNPSSTGDETQVFLSLLPPQDRHPNMLPPNCEQEIGTSAWQRG